MENRPLINKYITDDITNEAKAVGRHSPQDKTLPCDEKLIELRNGSHSAYREIYLTYKDSIRYFLQKLLGSADEAEDLTQTIFVNVWEKRDTLDPTKSIKSYLFSTARNSALNFFRHQKVHHRFINNEMYQDELDYDSDEAMIAEETACLIEIAVSRMPKTRREVFTLSRVEGLSNDEIAQKLNMSKDTVYQHISQALRDIREVLALFYILFIITP